MPAAPAAALLAFLPMVADCATPVGPADDALLALMRPGRPLPGPPGQPCPAGAIALPAGSPVQPIVDRAPEGAAFCVGAGVHRAETIAPRSGQRFFGAPGAVLRGSVELGAFERRDGVFSAPAPLPVGDAHGSCLPDRPACASPAAVFVDGEPVPEVARLADLSPGRFFFDRDAGRVVTPDDWRGHRVEASAVPFAFLANGARDVTVSGLVVEHYASPAQRGAIYDDTDEAASGWRIEHNEVRLNGGLGVRAGPGATVRANRIMRNGQLGVGFSSPNVRVEDNVIAGNNREGYDPAWEAGGLKGTQTHGTVIAGNLVYANGGPGLWCDIECRDVAYRENLVALNGGAGIFHEISGAAEIRGNVLRCNGGEEGWYWGAGILLASSRDVGVRGNLVLSGEGATGIAIVDQGRARDDGTLYQAARNRVEGNLVRFEGTHGRMGAASDVAPGSANSGAIEAGDNRFEGNLYRVPPGFSGEFAWGARTLPFRSVPVGGQERDGRLEVEAPAALTR